VAKAEGRKRIVEVRRDDVVFPHNLEAERSVLGAALVNAEAAYFVAEQLRADDFYRGAHKIIYAAIAALATARQAVDFVTVHNALRESQEIDEAGGPAYLSALTDGVPSSTNVPYYASILKDLGLKRQLLGISDRILAELQTGDHAAADLVARLDAWVLDLGKGPGAGELVAVADSALALTTDLARRIANRGAVTGIDTGITGLNEMTGGFQAGDLIILAARPSIGKTALVGNMALTAARQFLAKGERKQVGFFSLEMTRQQVEYRLLSNLSGVRR
jgi:replicative DNA helicase